MDDASFFEDLDEEEAKRSILVTDVPENISPKDVVIYFQKGSNGGGEVMNLDDHGNEHRSSVVITFEHPSIVEQVIQRQHTIKGKEVTVQRHPVGTRIPEIFSSVQARLNIDVFRDSPYPLDQVLRSLQRDFGIKCSTNDYGYIIHGSYKQITSCHKHILDEIRNRMTQHMPRGSAHDEIPVEGASPKEREATSTSTGLNDGEKDGVIFQSVPVILQFIFTVPKYAKRIQDIESKFNVKIRDVENGFKVTIIPMPGCTQTQYHRACDEYIELYQEINDGTRHMMSENILLRPGKDSSYSVEEAVKQVLQIEPVAIQEMEERDKWLFYGEETNVRSAISEVCKMLKIDNPIRKTRKTISKVYHVPDRNEKGTMASYSHNMPSWNKEAEENVMRSHKDFPGDKEQHFAIETKKGFRLTVYEGDIVQERVDVIVNTTDEYLGFYAGLSKAIVVRGGSSIEKEVKAESKRKNIIPGHIIVTGPGKLDCSNIFHLITHSRKSKDKCKAIAKSGSLDCLKLAHKRKLTSIAFPALETGLQGISLDACATAMINAVEHYMAHTDPKRGAIADIRFVHLDPKAAEVFKAELTKRFGDSIVKPSGRKGYDRDNDYETSSRPSPPDTRVDERRGKKEEDDVCPICLDGFHDPTTLEKCKHKFCKKCIDRAFQHRKVCPTCGMTYGVQIGNMPRGTMNHYFDHYLHLPGYERCGAIRIDYHFPSGTQGPEHPNPGQRYSGTSRTAFLPDCSEGREVLDLLKKAFNARLTFTIGTSVTTGASNVVTWNDIHHKTDPHGGATGFGYPDPTYLKRVKAELAAKGIN